MLSSQAAVGWEAAESLHREQLRFWGQPCFSNSPHLWPEGNQKLKIRRFVFLFLKLSALQPLSFYLPISSSACQDEMAPPEEVKAVSSVWPLWPLWSLKMWKASWSWSIITRLSWSCLAKALTKLLAELVRVVRSAWRCPESRRILFFFQVVFQISYGMIELYHGILRWFRESTKHDLNGEWIWTETCGKLRTFENLWELLRSLPMHHPHFGELLTGTIGNAKREQWSWDSPSSEWWWVMVILTAFNERFSTRGNPCCICFEILQGFSCSNDLLILGFICYAFRSIFWASHCLSLSHTLLWHQFGLKHWSLLQESSEPHHGGMPRGLELSHVEPWVTTEKPWEIRRFRIHQEDMTDMMNSFKNMTTWYDRYEDMTTLEDVVRCGPNCDFSTWAEDAVPSHVKLEPWDETLSDFKSLLHSVLFSLLCCHYCNCYSWFATCTATRIARGDASLLLFPLLNCSVQDISRAAEEHQAIENSKLRKFSSSAWFHSKLQACRHGLAEPEAWYKFKKNLKQDVNMDWKCLKQFLLFSFAFTTCWLPVILHTPLGQERGAHTGMDVLQEPLDIPRPWLHHGIENGIEYIEITDNYRSQWSQWSQSKKSNPRILHESPFKSRDWD